ncbi:hypothetical protein C8J57DRAFT_1474636 [Mycena rebaudengoi]|nr:hypothetical protein C8J57DRAFT_1474636 [Mycena rebaudengoi]
MEHRARVADCDEYHGSPAIAYLSACLPLCRDRAYLRNCIQYAIDIIRSSERITLFLDFLRRCVGPFISNRKEIVRLAMALVDERIQKEDELVGKPKLRKGKIGPPLELIVRRILVPSTCLLWCGGVNPCRLGLTMYPIPVAPIWKELARVEIQRGGMDQGGIDDIFQISQRMDGNIGRAAAKFTGTHLFDSKHDPKRRAKMRERSKHEYNKEVFQHSIVDIIMLALDGMDFQSFLVAACSNSSSIFFAAAELKAMLAHLVLNYDIKAAKVGIYNLLITPTAHRPSPTHRAGKCKSHGTLRQAALAAELPRKDLVDAFLTV